MIKRVTPPTLFSLLELQLEVFIEIERQEGNEYKLEDLSRCFCSYYDCDVRILNKHNVCVAKYSNIVDLVDIEQYKCLAYNYLLYQLDCITTLEYEFNKKEIYKDYPLIHL